MSRPPPYDTESALRATADKLQAVLEGMETHDDGEHESTIKHLARISVALTTVCAELRQHEKATTRELSKIPFDRIVAYLKALPMERREDLAKDITNADAEESLL